MTRSIVSALLGLLSVAAVGILPTACQSGGIGDPCTPEEEYNPQFAGFKVTEENIESRSFQCQTRICLVNHFQGRVSCPLGQDPLVEGTATGRHACTPNDASPCDTANGETCVEAAALSITCDPDKADRGSLDCAGYGNNCNPEGRFCQCATSADCIGAGANFICDANDFHCKSYVCHRPDNCQNPNDPNPENNKGKDCCVPGSDTPVAAQVCGQCSGDSRRNAEGSVYCSCRCREESDPDDGSNYCECPTGFVCGEIRKNVGLGDALLTGKYCIKEGSAYQGETQCGKVDGKKFPSCAGIGTGG